MKFYYFVFLGLLLVLSGCKKDEPECEQCTVVNNTFDREFSTAGFPVDVVEAPDGDIFVLLDMGDHPAVSKFSFDGSLLWTEDFTAMPGKARNIVADRNGDVAFTYSFDDFETINAGNLQGQVHQWTVPDTEGSCLRDYSFGGVDLDSTVNNSTTTLVKLSSSGSLLFSRTVPGDHSTGQALAALNDGYAFAAAQSSGTRSRVRSSRALR